jgi:hypothetical protein
MISKRYHNDIYPSNRNCRAIVEMIEPRVPVLIRIRASLKASVEELAKQEHRSTNQQIEFLLERALAQTGDNTDHSRSPRDKLKKRRAGD